MTSDSVNLLSRRVLQMEESATIRMAQLARDVKAQGHNVIDLSLGEPDFDTPDHIKEAAKKALDAGYTKYTPVPGLQELREAIVRKFKRDNDLDFNVNQIVVSNGAKQTVANLCLAMVEEGDEVILLSPYWVSYAEIVKMAGGVIVDVTAGIDQDYKATPAQIEAAITPRTKFILFSSPCNPTGSVYTHDELAAIAGMLARYEHVHIISDEIYEYINFTGKHASIGAFPAVKDRTVTINGFSKGFAMTGWRLGYMGGPEWIAKACTKIQGQFTSGATAFGQKAAAYALEANMRPTKDMCKAFDQRRQIVVNGLGEIAGLKVNNPQGAFYVFPEISTLFGRSHKGFLIRNSDDFCEYLLQEVHVATVGGTAFGAPNCFRISYSASDRDLREAVKRIDLAVGQLK
jgi:aspartate aminotransferase